MSVLNHKYKQIKGLLFFSYLKVARIFRVIINKPIHHVIGDSHSTSFLHPAFIIHHVGPSTAYKLNFTKSTTGGREKVLDILNKIYKQKPLNVIFVFGEIDVRNHIDKIANKKKISLDEVVDSTTKSYFNFLQYVKSKYPLINISIFNILPQGEEQNIYSSPHYVDWSKRSLIAILMNNKFRCYAKKMNFKFLDVYNRLIDKKGNRKKEYVFDFVHFNRKIMKLVLEELR
jgi:lysophospholipase L1-like esterase